MQNPPNRKNSNFFSLNPETVMQATEYAGFMPTGEFSQLNSYENRVFDILLENKVRVIAKFYRPGRWTRAAILEEHEFLAALADDHLAAISPLRLKGGSTLIEFEKIWVAFFPKVRGRLPQEFLGQELSQIGRMLAQLHNIGSLRPAQHRPTMDSSYLGGWETLDFLQEWVTPEVRDRYNNAAADILELKDEFFEPRDFIRIHGDCHKGNLLHDGSNFSLIDFDDFCNGPVVQDFWMLLSGDADTIESEKQLILKGYEELREFPSYQWNWVPLLRGLRIISYAGWIARRWSDPSFPRIFPEFNTYKYWVEETEALEKIAWSWT
jgi:Ser/Thr protein kinase RdoA (MazF antagonist)